MNRRLSTIFRSLALKSACFGILLFSGHVVAPSNAAGSSQSDNYREIRYSKAFDQEALYQKYQQLLIQRGCGANLFDPEKIAIVAMVHMDDATQKKQFAAFEQECLALLNHARMVTLALPGMETVAVLSMVALAVAITMRHTDTSSAGHSFAVLDIAFNVAFSIPKLLMTGYNLISTPENALKDLEDHFAKNMCYIPKVLWPKIINAFSVARHNDFERERQVNFLTFCLNLTFFKPKPQLVLKDAMTIDAIKAELCQRIDNFFGAYQVSGKSEFMHHIQINVAKFIDELVAGGAQKQLGQGPRYVYLHGLGGIGKTHFVQTLSEWIEELMPQSVRFEEIIINSVVDLEGDERTPSALLKVLRNQLMQNRRGSIVMFDEATWLNDPAMISAAKRVFNGDRSKLSSSYFGSNIDGSSVSLDMPPMLIFVASNDDIHDAALASRFDVAYYPIPTAQALCQHGLAVASSSNILQSAQVCIDEQGVLAWIESLPEKNYNFRYVAGNIESFLLQQKRSARL